MAKKNTESSTVVGRRKTSSARVRLYKGAGENIINNIKAETYFPGKINKILFLKPFVLTKTEGKYYFTAKISGGGKNSQLYALVHSLAKSLLKLNETYKLPLKKAGFLTRDSRVRLRRMVGTGGKARRKKQSPKR